MSLDAWRAEVSARHNAEVQRGLHDDQCEWRDRFYLCHCSKRRREAEGFTDLPGEVIWQSPLCPRCLNEVYHDGDGWQCPICPVHWSSDGMDANWTDDYGDLEVSP